MAEGIQAPAKAKTVTLKGRGISMTLALGFGRAMPTAGGPIYGRATRPQRKPLTVYEGSELVQLSVPVLLDSTNAIQDPNGLNYRQDVWPIVQRILALTRPKEPGTLPPDFTVKGPIPFSGLRCQMEWPEFVVDEAKGSPWVLGDGRTIRQALVLKLVEFVDPDPLRVGSVQGHNEGTGPIGPGEPVATEVQRQGETLVQIAARVYGTPALAVEIGRLNGIRDIRKGLDKGQRITLPAPSGVN